MTNLLLQADDVLRQRLDARHSGDRQTLRALVVSTIAFGAAYGLAMGSFGGVWGERAWLAVFSAAKVPFLLLATFAVSLPSFLVLNVLFGLRDDLGRVVRALAAAQAGVGIVLASFAPVTIFWNVSFADYQTAILYNAAIFAVASFAGQWLLRGYYRPLVARRPRHRYLMRAWLGVYAFVGIQMAWVLRPFVGDPLADVRFFREDAWGNAYVAVWRVLADVLR
ncbi:MAG: hypothetical protein DCC68_18455 [Planctomycetota bacterium]|nr:MAG: hypothetical protein DCC68_18455 [Planctomycetota bacterium]